jgi:cell division protein FtsB
MPEQLPAWLVGLSGAIAAIIGVLAGTGKRKAEAQNSISAAYDRLAARLEARVEALERKVKTLERTEARHRRLIDALSAQVVDLGAVPVGIPEE